MYDFLSSEPSPDFDTLQSILRGEKKPDKVHFVELLIDEEMIKHILVNYFKKEWIPKNEENKKDYFEQIVGFYYRMGYDSINLFAEWHNLPAFLERKGTDTAELSRGHRIWSEEKDGIIKSWDDFESIDWDSIKPDLWAIEHAQKCLPKGMKLTVGWILFEEALEKFFGYENLFIFSIEKPDLVEAVLNNWGKKLYEFYESVVQNPAVGAIFHCDDLGYKISTMVSPEFLRKYIFPWFKKYASLAHEQNKMFWVHSCGNLLAVMEDLIDYVKIDAYHSFQDVIIPVREFKKRYGDRIAVMGGIDVDKMTRMTEADLRKYVQKTLAECMPDKYTLGSGNSITNFIPPVNYLAMMDEGYKWATST